MWVGGDRDKTTNYVINGQHSLMCETIFIFEYFQILGLL